MPTVQKETGSMTQFCLLARSTNVCGGNPLSSTNFTFTHTDVSVTYPNNRSRPVHSNPFGEWNDDTLMTIDRNWITPSVGKDPTRNWFGSENWFTNSNEQSSVSKSAMGSTWPIASAFSKLGSGSFNAGVTAGEMPETINMISANGRRVAALASAIKSADMQGLANLVGKVPEQLKQSLKRTPASKRLANHWLEFSFGWLPLVHDTYGLIDALHKGVTTRGTKISAIAGTGYQSNRKPFKLKIKPPSSTKWCDWQLDNQLKAFGDFEKMPVANYCVVRAVVVNPTLRGLQELGLLNPASVAWELTRYSFVVDWFSTVGDCINNITSTAGLRLRGASHIQESRTVYTSSKTGNVIKVYQTIKREPVSSFVLALIPSAKLDWISNPSKMRMANALSLMRQAS